MTLENHRLGQDFRYRLAAALLLQQGEISLGEIEALPFVDSNAVARFLADELANGFDAERYQKRLSTSLWEEVIRLRTIVK